MMVDRVAELVSQPGRRTGDGWYGLAGVHVRRLRGAVTHASGRYRSTMGNGRTIGVRAS